MDKLNILILHQMGDPLKWRVAVRDIEYMLPDNLPEHNYLVHAADLPMPGFVKELKFDLIILGSTFLDNRYLPHRMKFILSEYDFVRESSAVKIALPQDDYDCSEILDDWLAGWNMDIVYTVCPEYWDVLYPKNNLRKKIQLAYTGYISDSWLKNWSNPRPHSDRLIDVSYRASKLPPYFGRIGDIKGKFGEIFSKVTAGAGLRLDISTSEKDFIPGHKWHQFMESSISCLVTNSGSSLHDPRGDIRRAVKAYLQKFPDADFNDVEKACFSGKDGIYEFTALSPRNIEAALAKTVQIAIPGSYSGVLKSHDTYIPLKADASNIREVLEVLRDPTRLEIIAERCRQAILDFSSLRASIRANEIIEDAAKIAASKNIIKEKSEVMSKAIVRYKQQINEDDFWERRRLQLKLKTIAAKLGAGYIRRALTGLR